jgi:hypothetical protein
MNLNENILRVKQLMGILVETREGLMNYLKMKSKEITGIDWPDYVLRDWLYRNTKEVGEMEPNSYKALVKNYLESFVEGHGKGHWEYKVLDISLDSFTEFVKNDLLKKMEGFINPHIPKDTNYKNLSWKKKVFLMNLLLLFKQRTENMIYWKVGIEQPQHFKILEITNKTLGFTYWSKLYHIYFYDTSRKHTKNQKNDESQRRRRDDGQYC